MTIFASTSTHNTDPQPWRLMMLGGSRLSDARFAEVVGGYTCRYDPRPEFDQPRAHEGNPALIAAREDYDGSDPWGFALGWLDALDGSTDGYADANDARDWGASNERVTVLELKAADGSWDLPELTQDHIDHAYRVFDRMADVARASGLAY